MTKPIYPRPTLSIIGLGYVGLPVAVAFARAGYEVIGFDVSERRIAELVAGHDRTASVSQPDLNSSGISFTSDAQNITRADIHIVAVPTPVDSAKRPDLSPLEKAAAIVGSHMKSGAIIVFESTVYPGATEEIAVPILEEKSGLTCGSDFEVGYSPERINPGDTVHGFEDITKIVSASSPAALKRLIGLYGSVVKAGIHAAPSIKTAEAAKVIENTQRDLNIALMNELSMIFHEMNIDTRDVLAGASTKWNFLPFYPGLVGGHCIGVDPYYLTHKAHKLGMTPQVISAGRGTNEAMPKFVAGSIIQESVRLGHHMPPSISVLGLTYKANVPDTRNSKVVDLVRELEKFGAKVHLVDPLADPSETQTEYGLELCEIADLTPANVVVLAVPHDAFFIEDENHWNMIRRLVKPNGLVADLAARLERSERPTDLTLWRM